MLDKNEKGALDSCGIETYIEYYSYFWTLDRPSLKKKYTMNINIRKKA